MRLQNLLIVLFLEVRFEQENWYIHCKCRKWYLENVGNWFILPKVA